ncbi:sulfatase-like hydrolase/transferase [Nonomuraea phyllanthi]
MPKPPSFDEADVSDKPAGVRNRPRIGAAAQARMRNVVLKGRLESLLSVDEAAGAIVAALRESGELANTLIVFTSDNGWMQGEHRIRNGKTVPYEESIRVPLIMRGLGLPAGCSLTVGPPRSPHGSMNIPASRPYAGTDRQDPQERSAAA